MSGNRKKSCGRTTEEGSQDVRGKKVTRPAPSLLVPQSTGKLSRYLTYLRATKVLS